MKFERVIDVSTDKGSSSGDDPAAVAAAIASQIYKHRKRLANIQIHVRHNGQSYEDTHQGYVISQDEQTTDEEQREAAKDLGHAIIEVCSTAQVDFRAGTFWRVIGLDEPDTGKPKQLFAHRFKLDKREPTNIRETENSALLSSNTLMRTIASDSHARHMEAAERINALADKIISMVGPVSEMAAAIAEQIRPSDAEMTHRTRMKEMELEAEVRGAEFVSKTARAQGVNETVRDLFERIPFDELGLSARNFTEHLSTQSKIERDEQRRRDREEKRAQAAEEQRHREAPARASDTQPSTPTNPPQHETIVTTAVETQTQPSPHATHRPDLSELCEHSRTLAEIVEGRRDTLADAIGDDWTKLAPLAEQTSDDAFDALKDELLADFRRRPKLKLMAMFTEMNKALDEDDDWRTEMLQDLLGEIGLFDI